MKMVYPTALEPKSMYTLFYCGDPVARCIHFHQVITTDCLISEPLSKELGKLLPVTVAFAFGQQALSSVAGLSL